MLTRIGWLSGAGAILLAVIGRIFGILELYLLAAAAGGLVVLAFLAVHLFRPRVTADRTLHPPRVHAGGTSRVDLQLTNTGRRRTPVLRLRDSVTGTRGANLLMSPLRKGTVVRAAYQLPTDRRGVMRVGPLEIEVSDPFGLVSHRTRATGTADLVVYPRIDELIPLPIRSGIDPQRGAENPHDLGRAGEDFYAIREYVVGDDLRRVHWPSTARYDELMIRQDEMPRFGSTSALIDVRRSAHTAESFELVISAAASILTASHMRGDRVRLLMTDGSDTDYGFDPSHLDTILHRLALATLTDNASLGKTLGRLAQNHTGGTLVMILARAAQISADMAVDNSSKWGSTMRVIFEPSSWGAPEHDQATPETRSAGLRITGDQPFASTWNDFSSTTQGVSVGRTGFKP